MANDYSVWVGSGSTMDRVCKKVRRVIVLFETENGWGCTTVNAAGHALEAARSLLGQAQPSSQAPPSGGGSGQTVKIPLTKENLALLQQGKLPGVPAAQTAPPPIE